MPHTPNLDTAGDQTPALAAFATAPETRAILGGLSETSLWRLSRGTNFPKPVVIARRRLWNRAELFAWMSSQRTAPSSNEGAE